MLGLAQLAWFMGAAPAANAQLSARVSIDSQYRSRGYAIADEKPVATAALSYDHHSGVYANGLVIVGTADSEIGLAGFEANLGYAARLGRLVSIDAGVARTGYARVPGEATDLSYTEIYAGLTVRNITARAYYSPDYFARNRRTLYTALDGNFRPLPKWNVNLHLGALTYLGDPPRYTARHRYDWRATVSRSLGALEVFAGVSGRGPGADYATRSKGRAIATFGAAIAF